MVLVGSAGYLFASSGNEKHAGYVKLTAPERFSDDMLLALKVGPHGMKPVHWLIKSAASAHQGEFEVPEKLLLGLVPELQGIQLHLYSVESNGEDYDSVIDDSVSALKRANWQTLVKVQEENEHIVVMVMQQADQISGLSIFARTPDNAVFVNVTGPFSTGSLAELTQQI